MGHSETAALDLETKEGNGDAQAVSQIVEGPSQFRSNVSGDFGIGWDWRIGVNEHDNEKPRRLLLPDGRTFGQITSYIATYTDCVKVPLHQQASRVWTAMAEERQCFPRPRARRARALRCPLECAAF